MLCLISNRKANAFLAKKSKASPQTHLKYNTLNPHRTRRTRPCHFSEVSVFRITVFWPSVETIGVDIQSMIGMQSMWTCTMDYFMIYLICDVCYLWYLMFSVYEIFWRTCISRKTQNRVVKLRISVNNSSSSRVMQDAHVKVIKIEDITCPCEDMKFIFECSTRYLTSEHRERVRYRVEREKIKFISISEHTIFCL